MAQHQMVTFFGSFDVLSIAIAALVVLTVPLVLHYLIYRSPTSNELPSFLLLGPSGSGKTTLLTLFEQGKHARTCTSQAPLTAECSLPVRSTAASSQFRSENDPTLEFHKKFLLADTPGHGKLRHYALNSIVNPQNLVGTIFMVDAADLSAGSTDTLDNDRLYQTATYLYDVLLMLQKNAARKSSAKASKATPFLIAANKQDLFTALPAPLVKTTLEKELNKIRSSRSKGLLDSGIGLNDLDEEREWLGDASDRNFQFSQLEDVNVEVKTIGGNATGPDGSNINGWWDWIASNL